jgi:DNA modification methylase
MLACMDTNIIHNDDCLTVLSTLPTGVADLVYLDPPFNIGLDYPGYHDRRPEEEYLRWLEDVFRELIRVLSPTGALWVQIGTHWQAEVCVLLKRLGLHWRDTAVWHYTFGSNQSRKFTPSWQALHWFTRHRRRYTFNADAVRVPSARQTKYKDRRANPKGKVPDNTWIVPRICGTFQERVKDHRCQTPLTVVERIVKACSNPGELMLDPMAGTGTACVAAAGLGRRYLGIELCEATAETARGRLTAQAAG